MKTIDWVNYVLACPKRLAAPIMTHPGIDLIGNKVLEAINDGEIHYKAIKAINEIYPCAAASSMMDLTVESEAFGCKINFPPNEIPTVAGRLVDSPESIEALNVPSLNEARIPQYLKAASLSVNLFTGKPIFAGCIGPFSLAGRLYDLSEIMTALFMEHESIEMLLEKCTAFLKTYIHEYKKIGMNGILMAEPAAGLLSSEMCDQFSSSYIKRIVEEVQDDSFIVILHNCGNTGHVTQSMLSTGSKGLHFGNRIDLVQALEEVPEDILVFGNLDPVGVFKMMKAEEVRNATTDLLQKTAKYRNFIISSGCDTPPGTPVENIKAFYDAVEYFNSSRN